MEKRAVIDEAVTPPEDDKFPPAQPSLKEANANILQERIEKLEEHLTKRLAVKAEEYLK